MATEYRMVVTRGVKAAGSYRKVVHRKRDEAHARKDLEAFLEEFPDLEVVVEAREVSPWRRVDDSLGFWKDGSP